MFRTLRAFAWMRWRVLVNALEHTGGRDMLERLSGAVEQIGPIIALVLLVPSAIVLAGLGGYAGYWLAAGEPVMTFEAVRILLLAACGFAVVGPMLMPSMEPTAIVRLLLLPIPRGTLYAAQAGGALSEPWILIALPVVLALPVGLAAGGAVLAAVLSLAAGALLILCLIGLSTLATLLLHLVVRDRRRGELLALLFIIVVPAIALLPGILLNSSDDARGADRQRHATPMPAWVTRGADVAQAVVPSELFARATRSSAQHEANAAILPLLVLFASATFLHTAGLVTFIRLLDSPSTGTRRRTSGRAESTTVRVPFLSRGSAAVAQAHVRLALRTPRGRSIVLSPFVVFVFFAIVIYRQGQMELGFANLTNGLNLATFGGGVCLLAILPFALNQFAIDGSGLTLALALPAQHATAAGRQGGGQRAHRRRYRAGGRARRLRPLSRRLALAVAEPAAGTRGHLRDRRTGSGRTLGDLPPRRRPQQHRPGQQRARPRRSPGTAPLCGLGPTGSPHRARHGGLLSPAGTDAHRDVGVVWNRRPRQPSPVRWRGGAVRSPAGESSGSWFREP